MSTTAADDGSSAPERVPLNLRVGKKVKENYEQCIAAKHGTTHPHAVTELERELRLRLERGTVDELYSSIESIAERFGKLPPEKKNLNVPDSETTVVRYRVAEPIKRGIESMMAETNHSNPGAFVETVMHKYAIGESADERLINLADRIKKASEHKFNDELSAKERRTKAIADELPNAFTLSEFGDAIESATKFSDSPHTRSTYLPRVFDEKGCTWHPRKPGQFVPADDVPPEKERNPRGKPYLLMDDSDKRAALKYTLYQNGAPIDTTDAVSILQGKPNPTTAEQLMRDIGKTNGFSRRSGAKRNGDSQEDVLKLDDIGAVENSDDHTHLQRVLADDETDNDGSTSADEKPETDGMQWVMDAAEMLSNVPLGKVASPDETIARKIALATTDNTGARVTKELLDAVTDEQIAKVRQYLADGTEKPDDEPSKGGVSTEETTTQRVDIDADEQFDELNQATAVRADGGKPTT
jgi:hypothetical protein